MRHFLTLCLALISFSSGAAVNIKHDEFVFTLPDGWVQVKSDDSESWSFESKEMKTSIVLSIVPGLNIPPARLTEVAKKFASIRKEVEQKARPGKKISYGDEWVELRPSGDVADIAYAAYDDASIFRFMGYVTQRKILSFWISTAGKDNNLSKQAFDVAFKGLKFYVP
ncbi:MAG: hypothetical protein QM803_03225 [Rhodocyclaceae bacterium]